METQGAERCLQTQKGVLAQGFTVPQHLIFRQPKALTYHIGFLHYIQGEEGALEYYSQSQQETWKKKVHFKSRPHHSPRYHIISQVGALPSAPHSHLAHCLKTESLYHRLGGKDKSDPSKQREAMNRPLKYLKYMLGECPTHRALGRTEEAQPHHPVPSRLRGVLREGRLKHTL